MCHHGTGRKGSWGRWTPHPELWGHSCCQGQQGIWNIPHGTDTATANHQAHPSPRQLTQSTLGTQSHERPKKPPKNRFQALAEPSPLPSSVMPQQQCLALKATREQLNRAPDGDGLSCPGTLEPPQSQELQVLPSWVGTMLLAPRPHCQHSRPWLCATLMAPDQQERRAKEPGQLLGKSQERLQEQGETRRSIPDGAGRARPVCSQPRAWLNKQAQATRGHFQGEAPGRSPQLPAKPGIPGVRIQETISHPWGAPSNAHPPPPCRPGLSPPGLDPVGAMLVLLAQLQGTESPGQGRALCPQGLPALWHLGWQREWRRHNDGISKDTAPQQPRGFCCGTKPHHGQDTGLSSMNKPCADGQMSLREPGHSWGGEHSP